MTKSNKFFKKAINKMLEPHGVDYEYVKEHPKIGEQDWFVHYTLTPEQHEEFRDWFIKEFKKHFSFWKSRAEKEFLWFDLAYGLRVE